MPILKKEALHVYAIKIDELQHFNQGMLFQKDLSFGKKHVCFLRG
jgi:hypothetical protein